MARKNAFLLKTYFKQGWLSRSYFNGERFCMPYCAEDRLMAGERFYGDYLYWISGQKIVSDFEKIKVDGTASYTGPGFEGERFRRALRVISKSNLPVIYKIVLEEKAIFLPKGASAREKLYFNDEIKGLLCRGLDELCRFYG